MPLRVGVDAANLLRDRRGIGRYVRGLIDAWTTRDAARIELTLLVPHAIPALVARRMRQASGASDARIAHRSHARDLDLLWFPWNGMTWSAPVPSVVTVHDVWPFVSPATDERVRMRSQGHYALAARIAKRFIAVSRFTADEAAKHLRIDPARIDVIPNGVGPLTRNTVAPATVAGAMRYVLFVGEDEPRKDVRTLIDAAALMPESLRASTAFVAAGKTDRRVAEISMDRGLRFEAAGEVSDERLASLYAGAAAFVFPSRHEGFGLPVLEAMLYGAPVVASDAPAVIETTGGAALTFPVGDASSLAAALQRVLEDGELARRLAAAGRSRAAEMTVDRCADRTLEAFVRALAS